ncbi:protein E6-like [Prunus avium]|uniref:Protein E6-like n=1 Tax=Prunus avium TaxID=42229 RepID=A0A6P5TT20_PRUAV|nr:protein E6-like [Prunus avium]
MASAAKLFSFLFFLASLLFSQQAQARESQFFSKVANVNNNNNYVKETEVPKTETPVKKQEQEPAFIPETQSGYGLYGHESGQLPPTTTTTGAPYTTTTTGVPYTTTNGAQFTTTNNNLPYTAESEKEQQHTNKYPETYSTQYRPNKNNFYYNGNNFESNPSDTRFTQSSYTTTTTPTNYQNTHYNYNAEKQGLSDARLTQSSYTTPTNYQSNNYYNVEKQGMSDTRFLENGKYYFDPSSENNYNQNQYENSRVVDSRNWYNNRGNYGNNNVNQNEDQFQESEDEFVP